ncbi:MAG TPA: LuxR family transcriptional regulator [Rhodobacteraceae bacterium]|nr:LuxR family transcriptional regulator [Paracoccaceae bacterium]
MRLRKYLHFVAGAQSMEELWAAHCAQMADFGFDRLLYGVTHYLTDTSLGDPDDFIVLTNHRPDYVEGFMHGGLYFHAPMLHWALEHEGAGSWAILGQMRDSDTMTPQEMRVFEFNRRMGVEAGYTISFKGISKRSRGAISLCAAPGIDQAQVDATWAEHGDDILLMNNIAHLKFLSLPYAPPTRALTRRQREALRWVGDGKTTQDIAVLMGLTPATVEKHLRLAREALAVETTAQAVLKAAMQNQIFVMEI